MAHNFTLIGRYLECAIQPELVVKLEFVLIERKHAQNTVSVNQVFLFCYLYSQMKIIMQGLCCNDLVMFCSAILPVAI